jgi:Xaa-Pro aminopeptidase
MGKFNLEKMQNIISSMKLDGWLFYDFRGSNDLALNILEIPKEKHLTRRFYYLIPSEGIPVKIVNAIEAGNLDHLPGEKLIYSDHSSLTDHLTNIITRHKIIAMEYSPFNAIPYVSKVDAGTIEQIKSLGADIRSSADLISMFDAVWTEELFNENKPVAKALYEIVNKSFDFIKKSFNENKSLNEFDVQQFIMKEFEKRSYFTDSPPIVGVNENSANPHYAPDEKVHKQISKGDFVLIDLWAKINRDDAVWADITWVGFMGTTVPAKYTKIFNIVAEARDAAFNLISDRFRKELQVRGYEGDDAARDVITKAGYGKYFIHRTGHSISSDLHGSGAHLDNYETRDERLILPSTSFSIEPGIYLSGDFGVRSEIDVFILKDGKVISTGDERQSEIVSILK